MDNSPRHCSFPRPARTDARARLRTVLLAIAAIPLAACGGSAREGGTRAHGDDATVLAANGPQAAPESALCRPSNDGYLRARLQGAIDAELDWSGDVPQCLGAPRPSGDGVRLLFKGPAAADANLLILIGAGPLEAGESRRNVPANLTVIREGAGEFYATQGDDKCALDEVVQQRLDPLGQRYRLTARGYCTQPARSLHGDGAVLVSRFDVAAIVEFEVATPATTLATDSP